MSSRSKALEPRRRPRQERARQTVDAILEGAARIFRREGWDATTNRIAEEAGVAIGSVYEYFPNKEALLLALAERHVELAEERVGEALAAEASTRELLERVQAAILASQRFPSEALHLVRDVPRVGPALRARADALEARVLAALAEHARRALPEVAPELAARVAFTAIGELTVRAMLEDPASPMIVELRSMAAAYLRA